MSQIASGTNNISVVGDVALDGGKVLVYSGNGNSWIEANASNPTTPKQHAQAYLKSLGITDDIDTILSQNYPEHLI